MRGPNFIVHVDGDAWWLLPAADADVATAAGAAVGAARVIKTETEKRNQSEKRKNSLGQTEAWITYKATCWYDTRC